MCETNVEVQIIELIRKSSFSCVVCCEWVVNCECKQCLWNCNWFPSCVVGLLLTQVYLRPNLSWPIYSWIISSLYEEHCYWYSHFFNYPRFCFIPFFMVYSFIPFWPEGIFFVWNIYFRKEFKIYFLKRKLQIYFYGNFFIVVYWEFIYLKIYL